MKFIDVLLLKVQNICLRKMSVFFPSLFYLVHKSIHLHCVLRVIVCRGWRDLVKCLNALSPFPGLYNLAVLGGACHWVNK